MSDSLLKRLDSSGLYVVDKMVSVLEEQPSEMREVQV